MLHTIFQLTPIFFPSSHCPIDTPNTALLQCFQLPAVGQKYPRVPGTSPAQVQGNWSLPRPNPIQPPGRLSSSSSLFRFLSWPSLHSLFSSSASYRRPRTSFCPALFSPRPFRVSSSTSCPLAAPCSRCALPENYPLVLGARLAFWPVISVHPLLLVSLHFICSILSLSSLSPLATPLPFFFFFYPPVPELSFPPTRQLRPGPRLFRNLDPCRFPSLDRLERL